MAMGGVRDWMDRDAHIERIAAGEPAPRPRCRRVRPPWSSATRRCARRHPRSGRMAGPLNGWSLMTSTTSLPGTASRRASRTRRRHARGPGRTVVDLPATRWTPSRRSAGRPRPTGSRSRSAPPAARTTTLHLMGAELPSLRQWPVERQSGPGSGLNGVTSRAMQRIGSGPREGGDIRHGHGCRR